MSLKERQAGDTNGVMLYTSNQARTQCRQPLQSNQSHCWGKGDVLNLAAQGLEKAPEWTRDRTGMIAPRRMQWRLALHRAHVGRQVACSAAPHSPNPYTCDDACERGKHSLRDWNEDVGYEDEKGSPKYRRRAPRTRSTARKE